MASIQLSHQIYSFSISVLVTYWMQRESGGPNLYLLCSLYTFPPCICEVSFWSSLNYGLSHSIVVIVHKSIPNLSLLSENPATQQLLPCRYLAHNVNIGLWWFQQGKDVHAVVVKRDRMLYGMDAWTERIHAIWNSCCILHAILASLSSLPNYL